MRPEMFFGRETVVNSVQRHLANRAHRNVILLEGNRRAGKSSILVQLERPEVLPDWVIARCDFQGAAGDPVRAGIPTEQVFSHLAQQIAEAGLRYGLNLWPPIQTPYDPKKPYRLEFRRAFAKALQEFPAFEAFKEFLEAVIEAIAPRRLLLMLDEFDRIQEGIDSGVTSSQVPQNIRFILNNYPAVTAILTGSRRMTQMRKEYWSVLFGLGSKIEVTAIDRDEARRLVTEPVAGRLIYPPSVVDRIVDLCACQPFLIQQLCSQVFDRSAKSKQVSVSLELVAEAANDLVSGLEHFEAFWDFSGSERARFILCIVHRLCQGSDGAPVTLPMIEDELERARVKIKRDELVGDELKKLIELELIRMEKDGQYRLAVPLLALWISRNKDFEDQRERAVQESSDRSL
jgi:type I restriction enzyme M protein